MGKRHVDHEATLDTPTTKKRKTDTNQTTINNQADDSRATAPVESNGDVTYSLTTDVVDGVILTDLCEKKWRCGKPIGRSNGTNKVPNNHQLINGSTFCLRLALFDFFCWFQFNR